MKLLKPVQLTRKTPIEELPGIATRPRIFIKRDDLNGLLLSGNKARKMEYLIADARREKCDTIITCGPIQSNHCRTAAVFAAQCGFHCHLFLRGKPGRTYTGNLLLDKLLNAKITYITSAQYEHRDEIMAEYAERIKKLGYRPYVIPEGGSNEIGALGYIACLREMKGFIKKNNIEAVYCAVGSGGTYAGLLLGKKITRLKVDLNGVIVCDTIDYFTDKIRTICRRAIQRFRLPCQVSQSDIHLIAGYIGRGYGIPYQEELEVIRRLAPKGVVLEPVYTGKAFYGMLQDLKKRRYKKVIFIHTGGVFSVFAFGAQLTRVLK